MKKILFQVDIFDWAIGHLVNAKVKHMPHFETKIIDIHPRDAIEKAEYFYKQVKEFDPDIIVYEYFRSAAQLIETKPELKKYTSILVHHNQRDKALFHSDWNELGIDRIVTHTNKCRKKLMEKGYINVETINHGIDLDFFKYSDEESKEKMIGYVGRICPWKGLKEIAEVAEELGYPVQIMGKQDKMDYWNTVPKNNLRYDFMNCSDEERIDAYHSMTVYVGNSEDNYEEGSLPYLEAMACGVSVVTTPNGVAKDIAKNEVNALVVPFKDKEALKIAIKRLMEDEDLRKKLRKGGYNTVRNMSEAKMAYEYTKLFYEVKYDKPLVSVIIPATFDRALQVKQILKSLEKQTHKPIEAVVVWDERITSETVFPDVASDIKEIVVKQSVTDKTGYNIAMARNIGAIEAQGEYLLFNDTRLEPEIDAVAMFLQVMEKGKYWLFGDKGAQKKSFIENFSFVSRENFMTFGMMNERITGYGGASQEIRTRWTKQGGQFNYIQEVTAKEIKRAGSMTDEKRKSINDMKFLLYKIFGGDSY